MRVDPEHYTLTRVVFYAFVAVIFYLLYLVMQPMLAPLAWAAVLGITVYPIHQRVLKRMTPRRAALLTTTLVTLLLILPTLLLLGELGRQAYSGVSSVQGILLGTESPPMPALARDAWIWGQTHLPLPPADQIRVMLNDGLKQLGSFLAGQATGLLSNAALFALDLLITLVALYFMLKDAPLLVDYVRRLLPFSAPRRERLLRQAHGLVFASVTSSLVVAIVQGALGGVIFLLLGFNSALFWGLVMMFLALLPAIGTALVWGPAALWLLGTGELVNGAILLALGFGVIGMVDNVLRPMLLSGKTEMNELLTLISLLGGIAVFGFLGIVLGPLLMATALSLTKAYLEDDEQFAGQQESKG